MTEPDAIEALRDAVERALFAVMMRRGRGETVSDQEESIVVSRAALRALLDGGYVVLTEEAREQICESEAELAYVKAQHRADYDAAVAVADECDQLREANAALRDQLAEGGSMNIRQERPDLGLHWLWGRPDER